MALGYRKGKNYKKRKKKKAIYKYIRKHYIDIAYLPQKYITKDFAHYV